MRGVSGFAVVAAVLMLGACGSEYGPGAGQEPTMSPSDRPTPGQSTPTPSEPATPGPIEQAKADLVGRLGVDPGQVTVVSREEVTWRDGSLGCPQPGMRYTQALVNGSRIILEVDGKRYHYHSGGRRGPFLCTDPQPPLTGG